MAEAKGIVEWWPTGGPKRLSPLLSMHFTKSRTHCSRLSPHTVMDVVNQNLQEYQFSLLWPLLSLFTFPHSKGVKSLPR